MIIDSGKKVNGRLGKERYFPENVRLFTIYWEDTGVPSGFGDTHSTAKAQHSITTNYSFPLA